MDIYDKIYEKRFVEIESKIVKEICSETTPKTWRVTLKYFEFMKAVKWAKYINGN